MPPVAQGAMESLPLAYGRLRPMLAQGFRAHSLFFLMIGLYVLAYALSVGLYPEVDPSGILVSIGALLLFSVPFMLISLVMLRFYHIARHVRPERPIPALVADLKAFLADPRRLANGLPMFLLFVGFGHIFVEFKGAIFELNGFKYDPALAALDATLHFGRQPWEWLQPLLGYPIITFLINVVYNMWFFVMWMSWMYFGFARETSVLRTRFFLTYFLTWIIGGSALAIWISSAGPAYYGRLVEGPNPFDGLMTYLHAANNVLPIWAVGLQEMLWQGHLSNGLLGEISAMPSMHNGTALLFTLAAYRVSRVWGRLMLANMFLILIGSVHLGWHYAVDGYVAWALCYVVWLISAPVAHWWHKQLPQVQFDAVLADQAA